MRVAGITPGSRACKAQLSGRQPPIEFCRRMVDDATTLQITAATGC